LMLNRVQKKSLSYVWHGKKISNILSGFPLFQIFSLAIALPFSLGICLAVNESILNVAENNNAEITEINETALSSTIAQISLGSLNNAEIEGLPYMEEEEKLAGDIYQSFGESWKIPIFQNIGMVERTHEAAVKALISRYG
jgi:hypothetical protein